MVEVRTIGLLYETLEDAMEFGLPLEQLDHWREEHEIAAVENAVQSAGFDTLRIGNPYDFIAKWSSLPTKPDYILTLSVGFRSRFRQALGAMACELTSIPYSGPDPYAKLAGQNKQLLKALLDKLDIPTPAWAYVHSSDMLDQQFPPFPLIVKPACEGTSVGISEKAVVNTTSSLREYAEYILHDLGYPVIVEKFIEGKEYKLCYTGNGPDIWRGMIEDVQEDGSALGKEFFHYDAKRNRIYKKVKRDLSSDVFKPLIKTCDFVYSLFAPADYAVFDIREDQNGNFFIIDYNMDATLHPDKTLATCSRLDGITYDQMIQSVLKASFIRQGLRWY